MLMKHHKRSRCGVINRIWLIFFFFKGIFIESWLLNDNQIKLQDVKLTHSGAIYSRVMEEQNIFELQNSQFHESPSKTISILVKKSSTERPSITLEKFYPEKGDRSIEPLPFETPAQVTENPYMIDTFRSTLSPSILQIKNISLPDMTYEMFIPSFILKLNSASAINEEYFLSITEVFLTSIFYKNIDLSYQFQNLNLAFLETRSSTIQGDENKEYQFLAVVSGQITFDSSFKIENNVINGLVQKAFLEEYTLYNSFLIASEISVTSFSFNWYDANASQDFLENPLEESIKLYTDITKLIAVMSSLFFFVFILGCLLSIKKLRAATYEHKIYEDSRKEIQARLRRDSEERNRILSRLMMEEHGDIIAQMDLEKQSSFVDRMIRVDSSSFISDLSCQIPHVEPRDEILSCTKSVASEESNYESCGSC